MGGRGSSSSNIATTHKFNGEKYARTVHKNIDDARNQQGLRLESLSLNSPPRESPVIVKVPGGGYSVIPTNIATLNKLKQVK